MIAASAVHANCRLIIFRRFVQAISQIADCLFSAGFPLPMWRESGHLSVFGQEVPQYGRYYGARFCFWLSITPESTVSPVREMVLK